MYRAYSVPGLHCALIAGALLDVAAGPGLARAQETAEPAAGDETSEVPSQEGEEISVTGSLIEQPVSLVTLPLNILDRAELASAGMPSTGDVLQDLPAQSNAINTQFNERGDGTTRVSLRGLGVGRSLVLVNGRRFVSGGNGANQSVDLGSIPIHVIDRIEVLKDGGAPLYGSGAIGGVVNIITRTDFDGVEASAYTGYSPSLGRGIYDLSVAGGYGEDRAHVIVQVNYFDHPPLHAGDREFSSTDKFYDFESGEAFVVGSTAAPGGYIGATDDEPGNEAWQALVSNTPSAAYINDPETGWRPFDASGISDTGDGDLYNYQPDEYLISPVRRLHLYGRAEYHQSEQIRGYVEAFYSNRTSSQRLAPTGLFTSNEGIVIAADNHYNPFGRSFSDVRRRMSEVGPRLSSQNSHTLQFFLGVEGRVPDQALLLPGWRWDLSYGNGQNRTLVIEEGNLIRNRLANALGPSHVGPDGTPRCGTADAPIPGCVPLDLFGGAGTITPEMVSYVDYTGIASGENQLHQALFTASGRLLGSRGGRRLSLAVGAEYQRHDGAVVPDALATLSEALGSASSAVEGDYDAREAYAELSLVPVVGSPLARHLEVVGAARYSDFTSDAFATWQLRGAWQSTFGLTLRAGYYQMFRAPSMAELYAPVSQSLPLVTDPCSALDRTLNAELNCSMDGIPDNFVDERVQLRSQQGGNRAVEHERATALNIGAAYHPPFVPGLGFELGYFHTRIEDQLQAIGAEIILASCYDVAPAERKYCDRVRRDPRTGRIIVLDDTTASVDAGPETSGMDIAVRYRLDTLMAGTFGLDWEGVWLQRYDMHELGGSTRPARGIYDFGVYPEWRYNVSASWWSDNWEASARLVYVGSFRECSNNDCGTDRFEPGSPDAPLSRTVNAWSNIGFSIAYTDFSPLGTSKLTLGASNVLDSRPPTIYGGLVLSTDPASYDFMGRYLHARFEQRF